MPAAFCDGPSQNWGVDERAEVGLISRNVKLTSDAALLPAWAASSPFAKGARINAISRLYLHLYREHGRNQWQLSAGFRQP